MKRRLEMEEVQRLSEANRVLRGVLNSAAAAEPPSASEAGFRAAWEAAFLSVQRTSNLTDWVRAAIDAYVNNVEPDSDANLTLIREARAAAADFRPYDDDLSERVSDLLVMLANALAARETQVSSVIRYVEEDQGIDLSEAMPGRIILDMLVSEVSVSGGESVESDKSGDA